MALSLLKLSKIVSKSYFIRYSAAAYCKTQQLQIRKENKTENNITYLEDPDTFGNLSRYSNSKIDVEDEGDIKEEQFLQNIPLRNQKLTIGQYADLIKQYLKCKRLKEAIDILEVRMLKEDKVKPENYIYNLLIGACADVGYTKKAFKLYNDMKRRALQPTGDTYTCLFEACVNSPWQENGLKNATQLRALMLEKKIEPNLTNYNTMIKAFGRCGDLVTAFKIIDEMREKKIKIRVHTFNHLLQACISDKQAGLRHALIIWRKMLKLKERPNIYSFNLMLRCVKDCNIGSKEDMFELINSIEDHMAIQNKNTNFLQIKPGTTKLESNHTGVIEQSEKTQKIFEQTSSEVKECSNKNNTDLTIKPNDLELVETIPKTVMHQDKFPNLLSLKIQMDKVLDLQEVQTPQEKFAIVGGLRGFLEEMAVSLVKPDIKTFTQMLPLLNDTEEENKMLDFMKNADIRTDIDFYNMLIKNRSMRMNYADAFDVMKLIKSEQEMCKKRNFLNKKRQLKVDIMTYGALALACKTRESGEKLLSDMKDEQLKVNIQILGALLRHGTSNFNFQYVLFVMDVVKQENIQINDVFLKHLENFADKCASCINKNKTGEREDSKHILISYQNFLNRYARWLKTINVEEALQNEHPWQQFTKTQPDTVQRQNIVIKEPKKTYKKSRKYFKYKPQLI